jgi:hypothetical protein
VICKSTESNSHECFRTRGVTTEVVEELNKTISSNLVHRLLRSQLTMVAYVAITALGIVSWYNRGISAAKQSGPSYTHFNIHSQITGFLYA